MAIPNPLPPITIRNARSGDVDQVIQLGSHVFNLSFGHSLEPQDLQAYLDEAYTQDAIADEIADPKKDLLVATIPATPREDLDASREKVVGFVLLTRGSSDPCIDNLESKIELQRLYVHADHQGSGIGKLLTKRVEEMAREERYEHMWLGVWEENFKAQKVYEKLGYKRVGEHGFKMGECVQTDLILVKDL